ncbi:hypothetical protein [Aquimarina addita]
MEDIKEERQPDDLIAFGTVTSNDSGVLKICKWNCSMDENGIYHKSELI